MNKTLSLIAASFVIAAPAITVASEGITLDEYLTRVRDTHPLFKAERLAPEIERRRSEGYLGSQDWQLLAGGDYNHVEPLPTSPFQPERVDVLALNAGTERLFWGSGSRLSVGWTSDVTDQNLPGFAVPGPGGELVEIPIGPSTFYRHILSATWSLPLWQNRGGELDRLQHDLSVFDVDASTVNSWEAQEDFLLSAGTTFLQWALAEEQVAIGRRRLDLAIEELKRSQRQRRAFLVEEVDVWRSEASVHNTESALYLIESQWKSVQADLATLAGDSAIYAKRPSYDLYDLPQPPDVDAFVDGIVQNSRLVLALDIQRDQLERLERANRDAMQPALDLNLRGALQGGDDDFGGALEMKYPDVGVALVFSYPIRNRTAKADVETTRLQIRQLEQSIREVQVSLSASARSIIVRMQELRNVIESNIASIEANEKRTEEELKLYNQGRGDLTFVIQSRDNVALSELEYAGNAATYHHLALQLEALSDRLLPTPPGDYGRADSNR